MSTAVVVVTRNNPQLLEHAVTQYLRHDPGVSVKYYIVDNDSDKLLPDFISKQTYRLGGQDLYFLNDRVERSFARIAYWLKDKHDHVFFAHDDCVPHKDEWLRMFHERMSSGYAEPE